MHLIEGLRAIRELARKTLESIVQRSETSWNVWMVKMVWKKMLNNFIYDKYASHNPPYKYIFPNPTSENCTFTVYFEIGKWLISQLLLLSPLVLKIAIFPSQNRWWKYSCHWTCWDKLTCFTCGEQAIINSCCKLHTHWQLLVFPTRKK